MFDRFYNLSGLPFLLTPDARFFFVSNGHARAMSHLVYGLSQQEGFIVITGEVGAGKTTLVEQIWAQLDRRAYAVARVVTTQVSADDLLRLAMANFDLSVEPNIEKSVLLCRFEQMVRDERQAGRRCLLVIDEVQSLSLAAMEELRMLSNIVVDGRASLQTILLGQPQFRPILASTDWEQLRQRVLASFHLGPLSETETQGYIEHRLRLVGWQDDPAWKQDAFRAVYRQTGGIPRRINTLCSRVMLLGALEESHTVTASMVDETAAELDRDLGGGATASALAPTTPGSTGPVSDLDHRIELLEQRFAQQELVGKRVLALLEAHVVGQG
jgi:general secretion pathway protein A